ncbi:polysaccharide pyruvyl transferase family protein [Microcystis elabens FACHB-917]|nr:polysaccharide pyruvyl transferase family protein [Microcystis elabens FACHB-917]
MSGQRNILRVLHVASFAGNIGDLANHAGARRILGEQLSYQLDFTELEMREFYWNQRKFDEDFVSYANRFDLLMIGGGNYLELWVDHSATGTSIDIKPGQLSQLTVPTIFFALGVDTGQGYSERSASRFSAFITTVLSRHDMFICVRNDGSQRALCQVLGREMASMIPSIPDGGFFADEAGCVAERPATDRIGINLAGDMLERRFNRNLSKDGFLKELAVACTELMATKPKLHIDLMPHIWRDCSLIAELLALIPDPFLRRRVAIGKLEPNQVGLKDFLDSYRRLDLVLGMRFHANVCPIGMGIPSRGLLNYPQIELLYEELGFDERIIDVREPGFGSRLVESSLTDLDDLAAQRRGVVECMAQLYKQASRTLKTLNDWLDQNR